MTEGLPGKWGDGRFNRSLFFSLEIRWRHRKMLLLPCHFQPFEAVRSIAHPSAVTPRFSLFRASGNISRNRIAIDIRVKFSPLLPGMTLYGPDALAKSPANIYSPVFQHTVLTQ